MSKRYVLCGAVLLLSVVILAAAAPARTAAPAKDAVSAWLSSDLSQGDVVAQSLTEVTTASVSPVFGLSALGVAKWWTTPSERRTDLPWYSSPLFWAPGFILGGALILKDVTKTPIHGPFVDSIEVLLRKPAAAIIAVATVAGIASQLSPPVAVAMSGMWDNAIPSAYALGPAPVSATVGGFFSSVAWVLVTVLGLAVFAVVWCVSQAFTVLGSFVPLPGVGLVPRVVKGGVLGGLAYTSSVSPWLGALYCVAVIAVSWLILGWSFRLLRFGLVLAADILLLRSVSPAGGGVRAFTSARCGWVPKRTYGILTRADNGDFELSYRSFPLFRRQKLTVSAGEGQYEIGRGLLSPCVIRSAGDRREYLFCLPPRYREHADAVAGALRISSLRDVGVREWFRGFFGSKKSPAAAN